MSVTPIFATQHDTEKPITYTLERALQADENLRLYVHDANGDMIPYSGMVDHWCEYLRGTKPWSPITSGTELTLFLECDLLHAAQGNGTYLLNIGIWDDDNADLELVEAGILVLQNSLKPGQ